MSSADTARKFHFLREIASGGFGRVYLAKVVHADGFSRLAAVKVLHPKWTENEEIAQRMRDEARLLGMLRHKNIVDVLDLTRIDGRVAVVMEYLEAVDLKVVISEFKRAGKVIPLKVVLAVFAGVASALDAAYNRPPYAGEKPLRVVHRDIKPSNIMVDANGLPKVLDFGVARAEFEAREAKTAELSFGSVEYMSPERLFFEPESPASDVYSMGATLFESVALEKFGKAKLRPEAHEQFVAERFEDLLEKNPMPSEEVEDLLHDLLYDMLAFEEAGRPAASDLVTRLRSFSRNIPGDGLEEWAEREVPPLVQHFVERPPRRQEGDSTSLVDRVLAEDTGGLLIPDDETDVGPEDAPLPGNAAGAAPGEGQWDALKQSTLASLAGEGLGPASSTWNPEAEPVLQKALGPPPVPDGVVSASVSRSGSPEREKQPPKAKPPRHPKDPPPAPVQALDQTERRPPADEPTVRHALPDDFDLELEAIEFEEEPDTPPTTSVRLESPVPSMPEEDFEYTEEAPSGGGWFGIVAVGALLTAGVAIVITLIGAGILALIFGQRATPSAVEEVALPVPSETVAAAPVPEAAPAPAPVPDGAPEPDPAVEEPVAPEPDGAADATRFHSHLDGTRKIIARCAGGTFEGTDVAVVSGEGIGPCTVTALGADRKRANAVVDEVEPRDYACFKDGTGTCE